MPQGVESRQYKVEDTKNAGVECVGIVGSFCRRDHKLETSLVPVGPVRFSHFSKSKIGRAGKLAGRAFDTVIYTTRG